MRGLLLAGCSILPFLIHGQTPAERLVALHVQVVDGLDAKPKAGVRLRVDDPKFKNVAGPILTDSQGKAEFSLKAGNYLLYADRQGGGGRVYYGQLPEGWIQTLELPADRLSESITFRIFPIGTVRGVVLDEWRDPMRAEISLHQATWQDGRIVFDSIHHVSTDDRGYYRIPHVTAGSYVLCATPTAKEAPEDGPVDFSLLPPPRYFQRSCIPEGAAPFLRVAAGEQKTQDFVIFAATAHTVQGRVTGLTEEESVTVELQSDSPLKDQSGSHNAYVSAKRPEFLLRGIPPGNYKLRAQHQASEDHVLQGRARVKVAGDVSGLEIPLKPAANLDVVLEVPSVEAAKASLTIDLLSIDIEYPSAAQQNSKSGLRSFPPLAAGSYWLRTRTNGEGFCVVGAKLGEADVFRKPIAVASGMKEQIALLVSSTCGVLKMKVVRDGKPVAAAKVVVLLSGTPDNPGDCYTGFSNPDGGFEVKDLAPGEYMVWAWPDDGTGMYVGPADLKSVASRATVVQALESAPKATSIELIEGVAR